MLKKRIIPCLDIDNGRTVKGVRFVDIRDAGDPVVLAESYARQGADELVFLDITATVEKRRTLVQLVEKVGEAIDIPFTVGGGIKCVEDVGALLQAGADKITLNSAAVKKPGLIDELAARFGSQCIVVAVDARRKEDHWEVVIHGGRRSTERRVLDWVTEVEQRGAGEILLTSMDRDGTREGFDLPLTRAVAKRLRIPLIASGGAGKGQHFVEVFRETGADAALAAGIFHFSDLPLPELKHFLKQQKLPIR